MIKFRLSMSSINIMSSNTNRSFSCVFCGVEYNPIKPDDIHIKANKYKINRDDIETTHKCNECGKNTRLYWSEQKGSN